MVIKSFFSVAAFVAVTGLGASVTSAIVIPTVPIGNPGNAPDPLTGGLYGSVAYRYSIGTTEVTNAQYAAFLNAIAAADTNNIYELNVIYSQSILRAGSPGSYTYASVEGRENLPVRFVTFGDACRFANWLHNGQPTGPQSINTTEDGAYTLTTSGITNNTITRNGNWQWAVTSEDEWYKAAYHQPASLGGDSDDYWYYPTSSNIPPTTVQAAFEYNLRPVGSYAANFYGTFDMAGNVREWNEAVEGLGRGLRGGDYLSNGFIHPLSAGVRGASGHPEVSAANIGFRVVQIPGPSSVALMAIGGLVIARRRR